MSRLPFASRENSGTPDRRMHGESLQRRDQFKALDDCVRDIGPLEGKSVLEVGSDPEGAMLRVMKDELGAFECVGVNREVLHPVEDEGFRLLAIDGSRTGLPSETIDLVFSHATLEHVLALDTLLGEIHRVLRPNGKAWLSFGPVWSSSKGHHLWVKHAEGKYTFTQNNPIPDYAHLLWTKGQLRSYLREKGFGGSLVDEIAFAVYESQSINRLFFEDYMKAFHNSRLSICRITKLRDGRLTILRRMLRHWQTTLQLVQAYPRRDLCTYGAVALLQKPQ